MRRLAAAFAAAVFLIGASYTVRGLTTDDPDRVDESTIRAPGRSEAPPRLDEVNRLIGVFEGRLVEQPYAYNYRTLATLHLDRARLNGDLGDYRRAARLFDEALSLAPGGPAAERGLASASLALHRFDRALDLARSRLAADPLDAEALLIAADGRLEVGDVTEAAMTVERLALLAPGEPAVHVRRAELAHLTGNQHEAIGHAAGALAAAKNLGLDGRSLAFYFLFLADLQLDAGDHEEALRLAESALNLDDGWAEAHASLAGIHSAMGDYQAAIDLYSRALKLRADDPEWLVARADLLTATGRSEQGAGDLARAVAILDAEDPVVYGRALSRLYADHGVEPEEALRLAEDDLTRRQDVLGYDTYGWALYRNGRHAEAAEAIGPVLESGIQDAEARFHIGMIAASVGDAATAVAHLEWVLDTNPHFHPLLAAEARRVLAELS